MIFENPQELKDRVQELAGRKIYGPPVVSEDTTEYMRIHGGMILRLDQNDYFIRGDATEGRFGIEEQPKFWVKYAVDLASGEKKVIKLVFYEDFTSRIGPFLFKGARSPQKEARVLRVVKGHPNFMQGRAVYDHAGNLVRILDFVRGANLYTYINELKVTHEEYFFEHLPAIMPKLIEAFDAIGFLETAGEHHGDVRTDHIIIEEKTGRFTWIDYDFHISHSDFDLWSLGSVLVYVVGKGAHTFHDVMRNPDRYAIKADHVEIAPEDGLFLLNSRITNLAQLFPYIPDDINKILRSFSIGTDHFYESVKAITDDLKRVFL